jgi:hypothetical protein
MVDRASALGIHGSGARAWGGREGVLCLIFLAAMARPTFASELPPAPIEHRLEIRVRIYNYAKVPKTTLSSAIEEARRIFQKANVETDWVICPTAGVPQNPNSTCDNEKHWGPAVINLRILPESMAARLDGRWEYIGFALSTATPGAGSDAWVFHGRVEELAASRIVDRKLILGAAMAHEIGHLLLGLGSHSPGGIMRARWHREEMELEGQGYLLFTSRQSDQIRSAVSMRLQQAKIDGVPLGSCLSGECCGGREVDITCQGPGKGRFSWDSGELAHRIDPR